jgi:RNA polymerase sigma-70 factor (ECF subfamily)
MAASREYTDPEAAAPGHGDGNHPGNSGDRAGARASDRDERWLALFHAGARDVLETCYRAHFSTVERAVGQILRGADRETVVHEVFLQLLANERLRRGFSGGSLVAWLTTIARNQAIDFWRRHRNEQSLEAAPPELPSSEAASAIERSAEARLFAERFRRALLPAKWVGVFEARFLAGLDQRTAAARLGISRTTLAYRELQVRRLLKQFLRGRNSR